MKEIKFRAWNKKNKWVFMDFSGSTGFSKELLEQMSEQEEVFKFNTPLMQYTGLKDKEGKEIYEGDIVSYIDIPTGYHIGNYEVIFDAGFIGINTLSQSNLCDIECHKYVEVIGNKYDNPELLKQ